jgi:hypothetical protein
MQYSFEGRLVAGSNVPKVLNGTTMFLGKTFGTFLLN